MAFTSALLPAFTLGSFACWPVVCGCWSACCTSPDAGADCCAPPAPLPACDPGDGCAGVVGDCVAGGAGFCCCAFATLVVEVISDGAPMGAPNWAAKFV